MASIRKIVDSGLCLGCGLCEAIDDNCRMVIGERGFYRPEPIPDDSSCVGTIGKLCPAVNVHSISSSNTSAWGRVESVCNAWSTDEAIRKSSSSGGVTTALALYLLESGTVDGILHVGAEQGDYLHNKLHVSYSREDVLSRNSSRYAPAAVFNDFFGIFSSNPGKKFAFIGKPCDIAAVRNLQAEYPEIRDGIKYCLAIFCAGMPSYNATESAIKVFGHEGTPRTLRYRGNGWPGFFTVAYDDGAEFRMSYNDSWGKILGKQLGFRCKICPDGIGLLADIASGDSWHTKDGYPDFSEADGRNFCFIRTSSGQSLFDRVLADGYVESECLKVSEVRDMQAYQYKRRHCVGWGIAVVQILTAGLLSFKGLGVGRMALKTNILEGLKFSKGTLKRFIKMRRDEQR